MVALRPCLAALALFRAGQLFDFAVGLLDLPAHVVRFFGGLRGQVFIKIIGNEPVNVAVCGDQPEQFDLERHFFQFDGDTYF